MPILRMIARAALVLVVGSVVVSSAIRMVRISHVLAYLVRTDSGSDIHVMDMRLGFGRNFNVTRGQFQILSFDWSSNNNELVVASISNGSLGLYVTDLTGKNMRLLADPQYLMALDWSVNDNRIVFNVRNGRGSSIYISDIDGSDPNLVLDDNFMNRYPALSPDGNQIAFVSNQGESQPGIYLIQSDGSNIDLLTTLTCDISRLDWSPDGQKIAFSSCPTGERYAEIFVIDLSTRNVHQVTESGRVNIYPLWSAHDRITFWSTQCPVCSGAAYSVNENGSDLRFILDEVAYPAFSP